MRQLASSSAALRELSPPFKPFWTALPIRISKTRSNGVNCPTARLPDKRSNTITITYTATARSTKCHHGADNTDKLDMRPPRAWHFGRQHPTPRMQSLLVAGRRCDAAARASGCFMRVRIRAHEIRAHKKAPRARGGLAGPGNG